MTNEKLEKFLETKIKLIEMRLKNSKDLDIPFSDERFKVVEGMLYAYEEMLNFIKYGVTE